MRSWKIIISVVAVTWLLLEVVLWAFFQINPRGHFLFLPDYQDPPLDVRINNYLSAREPILGWAPLLTKQRAESNVALTFDEFGSRFSPAFPEPGPSCASVYGDSFALSEDVSNQKAWSNLLAIQMNCRVNNYGMSGYGVDQAVLRFELNETDRPKFAILAIYPHDLLRNLTHNVGLVLGVGLEFEGLKPRFEFTNDGELKFRGIPFLSSDELRSYAADPLSALSDDWFHPTGYWARKNVVQFPYTKTFVEFITNRRTNRMINKWRSGEPIIAEYYFPEHPR